MTRHSVCVPHVRAMPHVLGEPQAPLPCNARIPPKPPPAPLPGTAGVCALPDKVFRRLHELTSVEKQLCSPVHIKGPCELLSKGNGTLQGHTLMYVT